MAGTEDSGDARTSFARWEPPHFNDGLLTPVHHHHSSFLDQSPEPIARHDQVDNARYLDELVKDMRTLDAIQVNHPEKLRNAYALLTAEIDRVWNLIYSRTLREEQHQQHQHQHHQQQLHQQQPSSGGHQMRLPSSSSPTSDGTLITIQEKIMIPQRPDCKFIGRILGPRGISVKQLEAQTDCRILIRGKGSVKDSRREARLRNRAGWEHLAEPLHVLITANDVSHERCAQKLANGVHSIKSLLSSNNDEHKRCQLVQLAIINGTYRPTRSQ